MSDLCSVSVTGTMTADPEYRGSADGRAVCRLRIAFERRVHRAGSWETRTNYIDLIAYGALGSICAERGAEGARVAASGEIRWREVSGPKGRRFQRHEVVVSELEFLSAPVAKADQNGSGATAVAEEALASPGTLANQEDDIPF